MYMDVISRLPEKSGTIGAREIAKGIKAGKIKHIVIASNCPDFLLARLNEFKSNVKIEAFGDDEAQLGTKLGKPFPVAMVGYE
jgi:ribosomal protein L30E